LGIDTLTNGVQGAAIRVDLHNNLNASAHAGTTANLDSAVPVIGVKLSCGKTEPNHQSMFGDNSPDRTFLKVDVAWSIDIDSAALKRLMGRHFVFVALRQHSVAHV
jgi:hypothetical protein